MEDKLKDAAKKAETGGKDVTDKVTAGAGKVFDEITKISDKLEEEAKNAKAKFEEQTKKAMNMGKEASEKIHKQVESATKNIEDLIEKTKNKEGVGHKVAGFFDKSKTFNLSEDAAKKVREEVDKEKKKIDEESKKTKKEIEDAIDADVKESAKAKDKVEKQFESAKVKGGEVGAKANEEIQKAKKKIDDQSKDVKSMYQKVIQKGEEESEKAKKEIDDRFQFQKKSDMLRLFFLSTFFVVYLQAVSGAKCPAIYKRFSTNHSFCKAKNPNCKILSSGLTWQEKDEVLDEHNKYRSRCATGHETEAGSLPNAANMMELVWDAELARIAQKWAQQCNFSHDCTFCRAVYAYKVGQNVGKKGWNCPRNDCTEADKTHKPDWRSIIKLFLGEIKDFDKSLIKSIHFKGGATYGHLTQILWAKTWRIGCGYAAFQADNKYTQLYVCNYGPSGNIISKPMYIEGKPCTQCPINTCCGDTCEGSTNYEGLCHMLDTKSAPIYPEDIKDDSLFFSNFAGKHGEGYSVTSGVNEWKFRPTVAGSYLSIELNGGESSTLSFDDDIVPSTDSFCMQLQYRKGPIVAEQKNTNNLEVLLQPEKQLPVTVHLPSTSADFLTYNLDLGWGYKTKVSMKFSVPPGAPRQYLDVRSVVFNDGKC